MMWPSTDQSEQFEIRGFVDAYSRLPEKRYLTVLLKRESPDYIVVDENGIEYGVELTSVYLDSRSVPDVHMAGPGGLQGIPYDRQVLGAYNERLLEAIQGKGLKAAKTYDLTRRLILAIYVNEYVSIYMTEGDLSKVVRRYIKLLCEPSPFYEIVFWNLPDRSAFGVRLG